MAKFELGADPQACGQPLYSSEATARHTLGERMVIGAREFRYAQAGAVNLVVGNALQAKIEQTDMDTLAVPITAIGSETVTVTLGNTALTANQYVDGWLTVSVTPGLGYQYPIKSHPAADASATCVITLAVPLQVALTASSKVELTMNPYKGVIQHPVTTATGVTVGGAIWIIAATEYGWINTHGPGAALIAGTPAAGQPVTAVGAVAGALTVHSAELSNVAYMMKTGVNTEVGAVYWLL